MIEIALFGAAVLLALYLLQPAMRPSSEPRQDPRAALEAGRAVALRALHDLELDWATGKLSDEDYRAQRAALESEAAAIARRLSAVDPSS
ncbi:MAG: hypothetical protein ACRDGN_00135 [bacterium]